MQICHPALPDRFGTVQHPEEDARAYRVALMGSDSEVIDCSVIRCGRKVKV